MLGTIYSRLQGDNCYLFEKNYKNLFDLKETETWKELILKIKKSSANKPFVKGYFDLLKDKFDYKRYAELVQNDNFYRIISNCCQAETIEERQLLQDIIYLYFITETYIGFIIETLITEELDNRKIRYHKNDTLDLKYKTDLLVCGKHLQIKNFSFLETERLENKIIPYIKANKRLYFVFYKISRDKITMVRIGGNAYIKAEKLNDFIQLLPTEEIILKKFIDDIVR